MNSNDYEIEGENIKLVMVRVRKVGLFRKPKLEAHIILHNGQNLYVEDVKPVLAQLNAVQVIYKTQCE